MCTSLNINSLFILTFLLTFREVLLQTRILVRNIRCEPIDKTFCHFEICGPQYLSDGSKEYNLHIRILKLPVTNCHLQFELNPISLSNVPMVFNATYDACQFMKSRKRYRVLNRFYNTIQPFVNINHTCPYNVGDR